MPRRSLFVLIALMGFAPAAHAGPTNQQLCESAMELASAKYAQCRLTAESKDSKAPDAAKLTAALGKCSQKLSDAFAKATDKYGAGCAASEPSSAFDDYLKQCSDDTTAAAAGASLPDYVGDLASCNADLTTCDGNLSTCDGDLTTCNGDLSSCNADLTTCDGDLSTCNADLATAQGDLTTCEGDLATCEALPPARLLKTSQTTAYGAGSDGDLQKGIAQNYVDNGDGTITDTKTGLMWEKKDQSGGIHDYGTTYTWSGPSYGGTNGMDGTITTTFLATLNGGGGFAGHTDWRIPNQNELLSLVNYQNLSPAVNTALTTGCAATCQVTTCSCTKSLGYWSSTTSQQFPNQARFVTFLDGSAGAGNKSLGGYVRAVRGGS